MEFQLQMRQFVLFFLFLLLVVTRAYIRKEVPTVSSEYWESVDLALLFGGGQAVICVCKYL